MTTDDLKQLATQHGSDKWNGHWYAQHYERHFTGLRLQPVRLLEIGIGGYKDPRAGGQSLRMWKDYFPYGNIVGLDLYDKTGVAGDRIRVFQGSQADTRLLDRIVAECGPFDLIVDDGSHRSDHVVTTFRHLFELGLTPNGIYAVEDTQTSYWRAFGGQTRVDAPNTSMAYFKGLCDRLNFREWHRPGYRPDYVDLNVVGMHFYHNLVFVDKGRNSENSNLITDNRVPLHLRTVIRGRAVERATHVIKSALSSSAAGKRAMAAVREHWRRRQTP